MACDECEDAGADPVRVKFTPEKAIVLSLCDDCLVQFRESQLVHEVVPVD